MQPIAPMISKKSFNTFLKGVITALPVIPFIKPKKSSSVLSYVLGGVGLSIVGGIAALMYFSPRTRTRALDVAKDAYGKVNDKFSQLKSGESHMGATRPNGLVSEHSGSGYQTTGL
jgi:hypothetical protein